VTEMRTAAASLTGRNCRPVRRVLALADGLAGSPQETRLRLLLGRTGVPAPGQRGAGRSGGASRTPKTSLSATRAALSPHAPCTAGPGGVAAEAR
jgi:hypothetical protein